MPEMESVASKNGTAVHFMYGARPPILRISWLAMAWMTQPEPRKSKALKKAWVKRWNMPSAVGLRHAQADKHIAKLADGGIGQHALDVVLHQGNGGGKQRGEATDVGHDLQGLRASMLKDDEGSRDQIDACGHHGGGVNQGADWRGAFHRVGQPDVQRELGRFAHRAAENQDHGDGQQGRVDRCPRWR